MNNKTTSFMRCALIASALSIASVCAADELGPASSLKLSGCVFTLDQFVNNVGSDGTPVSEAYRIYLISGFSFEDVIFLKKGEHWRIYWRNGLRENVNTDFSNIPLFKTRFNSDVATRLLESVMAPGLWNEKHHDAGDAGEDGFKVVAARWSNGVTDFKHFRSKTNTKELADAADQAIKFWKFFEAITFKAKSK